MKQIGLFPVSRPTHAECNLFYVILFICVYVIGCSYSISKTYTHSHVSMLPIYIIHVKKSATLPPPPPPPPPTPPSMRACETGNSLIFFRVAIGEVAGIEVSVWRWVSYRCCVRSGRFQTSPGMAASHASTRS